MSTTKRINGDYYVYADNMSVSGNLTVDGTTTTVNSTDLDIKDTIVTLNKGETGAGITTDYSGFSVDRGTETNARLLYDDTTDQWKIDQGDGSLIPIVGTTTGTIEVVDDLTPQLGGDLDVNGHSIISVSDGDIVIAPDGTGQTKINSAISLLEVSDPSAEAGVTKLYAKEADSGGTGLFMVTDTAGPEELVSKSKAIVYGIIF